MLAQGDPTTIQTPLGVPVRDVVVLVFVVVVVICLMVAFSLFALRSVKRTLGGIDRSVNHIEPGMPTLIERVTQTYDAISHIGERTAVLEEGQRAVQSAFSTARQELVTTNLKVSEVSDKLWNFQGRIQTDLTDIRQNLTSTMAEAERMREHYTEMKRVFGQMVVAYDKLGDWIKDHTEGRLFERHDDHDIT